MSNREKELECRGERSLSAIAVSSPSGEEEAKGANRTMASNTNQNPVVMAVRHGPEAIVGGL